MAQQSDLDVLYQYTSHLHYGSPPFQTFDESSLEPSTVHSTQAQNLDAEYVDYQSDYPGRISALVNENIQSPAHWSSTMQQLSHCSLDQGASYAYATHRDTESTSHNSSPGSTGFHANFVATYSPPTGEGQYPRWGIGSATSDVSIASDSAYSDPDRFDFNPTLSNASLELSPDQSLRTSFRHNSVASSSPRRHVHRLSPYAATQRGRSISDGAAIVLNMANQSTYPLNNITSTPASALQHSNAYASGQRTFNGHQGCSVSLTDTKDDLSPSLGQYVTDATSDRPLTPPNHDYSPSDPRRLESPSLDRTSSPPLSSGPPDLFSDLLSPSLSPPTQPPNIAPLKPRHQNPRFPSDLYTPTYTRKDGPLREGWCGFCRPGRWLVLKNSAFWYDKCFGHGICATTGARFEEPEEERPTRGKGGDVGGWEGRCGTCGEWVVLAGGKRSGVPWFRHAYKCHTHAKVPSTSKNNRGTISTKASKPDTGIVVQPPAVMEQVAAERSGEDLY